MAYNSKDAPKSAILNSTFINRLNSVFGFRTSKGTSTEIERKYGIKFVRVDLNNDAYRVKNAAVGSIFQDTKYTTNLEHYFDAYLNENTISYNDIQERQQRLNELSFMYYNDCYISRVCKLVADEATQLDVQNRIISIESPNISFTQRCYELFSIWGLTQQRIHGACFDLELYGEAFWAQKLSMKTGISKIIPISVNDIMERLEFNPEKMAKYLAEKDGSINTDKNRGSKLQKLVQVLTSKEAFDNAENLADMFDTKLLGYELADGTVVPPWTITHFRFDADHSEFYPYGRPPLLACLAPFKQTASTMALQGLARSMSFPVTLYKVKVTEGISPGRAFDLVNEVHEEYDNIGVTPASAGSEVYTVNTKIWIPEGLMDVDIKESKVDLGSIDDLEMYAKRVATAAGVPRSYIDPEAENKFGQSGISLMEQYKPFARHVSEIQSAFLQGLGELIRLHFAITGEYDYNTPFILSMRFPASEMGEDQRNARTASIDLAKSVVELLQTSLGMEDGEALPQDVMEDILSKYTFLDPTDIQKWMNQSAFLKASGSGNGDSGDDGSGGDNTDLGLDTDSGGDTGGAGNMDLAGGDTGGEAAPAVESMHRNSSDTKKLLQEHEKYIREKNEKRLKSLRERYSANQENIYFKFLENNGFTSWEDHFKQLESVIIPKIDENSKLYQSVQVLSKNETIDGYNKLKEQVSTVTLSDMLNNKVYQSPDIEIHDEKLDRSINKEGLGQ
jgi:hypothetical protein